MHTPGAQVLKFVHPAAKICTQSAGCTLNFEHCVTIFQKSMSHVTNLPSPKRAHVAVSILGVMGHW